MKQKWEKELDILISLNKKTHHVHPDDFYNLTKCPETEAGRNTQGS